MFTGVSGSGKSSLVFGTIAAESQRLINETYDGTQDGTWKSIFASSCTVPGYSTTYYHNCSGGWIQVSNIGDPHC